MSDFFPGTPSPVPNEEEVAEALRAMTGQIPVDPDPVATTGSTPGLGFASPLSTGSTPIGIAPHSGPDQRSPAPPPAARGWGSAAIAINSFRHIENPLVLLLQPEGHAPIVIDLMAHEFSWSTHLDRFPADPGVVRVGTQPVTDDSPSPLRRPGQDLDDLLWLIGLFAFPNARAPWLLPDERLKLRRWPHFQRLRHTPDQQRVIRVLARGFMTVDKLARTAKVEPQTAQQVVNALALMMALRRTGGDPVMPRSTGSWADLSRLPPPGTL